MNALVQNADAPRFDLSLLVHSTLRHEEYVKYDERLVAIARERLTGIGDLQSAGLVVDYGFGTEVAMYERVGDTTAAEVNMDGRTDASNDRVTYDEIGVPLPIIQKRWSLGKRQIESSRMRGAPLPTDIMEASVRAVSDTIEGMLFNGLSGFTFDGKSIYGYTTHPDRNTITLSGAWTGASVATIQADTVAMLKAAYADNMFGPFTMYVAKDIWANIQRDYSDEKGDRTHLERILAYSDIAAVRPGDMLASGNVVLVQLSSNCVDLAVAQDMRNVQWEEHPMSTDFMIYAAMAPRIKSDKEGRCGVIHASR